MRLDETISTAMGYRLIKLFERKLSIFFMQFQCWKDKIHFRNGHAQQDLRNIYGVSLTGFHPFRRNFYQLKLSSIGYFLPKSGYRN
ncbi:unnamed protein product [Rhizophagus irregularis]|nr:unnamed protein product [Rhizophagus irregularis]